jgi:uncharacterized protein YciI
MSNVQGTGGIDETHGGLQKLYFVCFSNPARPPAELEANLEAHKAYLSKLEREGKLLAAGPLLGDDAKYDGTGLLVYRVSQRKEAEAIAQSDPFHAKGLRTYTLKPWQVNEGSFDVRLLFSERRFDLP